MKEALMRVLDWMWLQHGKSEGGANAGGQKPNSHDVQQALVQLEMEWALRLQQQVMPEAGRPADGLQAPPHEEHRADGTEARPEAGDMEAQISPSVAPGPSQSSSSSAPAPPLPPPPGPPPPPPEQPMPKPLPPSAPQAAASKRLSDQEQSVGIAIQANVKGVGMFLGVAMLLPLWQSQRQALQRAT